MGESWKEDRLDVAEHIFGKVTDLQPTMDTVSAEVMADTLQHIGFDIESKGDHIMALKWLKRAYDIINGQSLEKLSSHGLELRLAICHGLVQALMHIGTPESLQEAGNLIAYVESEIGDKPIVLHWRLEMLQRASDEVFDVEAYSCILRRMVKSFDSSDGTFNFLLHRIQALREKSSRLARGLLDELLLKHILPSKRAEWIGKIVVQRIWMSTMEVDPVDVLTDLKCILDTVYDQLSDTLGPDTVGAAHLVSSSVGSLDSSSNS